MELKIKQSPWCQYNKCFCIFALTLLFDFACSQNTCNTATGIQGTCIPYRNCAYVTELFNQRGSDPSFREYLLNSRCTGNTNEVHICCQNSEQEQIGDENYEKSLDPKGVEILKSMFPWCGTSNVVRLSGGQRTSLEEFPWMALLRYDTVDQPLKCGASLITTRYVLTAAHCVVERDDLIGVVLGEHNLDTDPDCELKGFKKTPYCTDPVVEYKIIKKITHENYGNYQNDIALLKVDREVQITRHIKPICLPYELAASKINAEQQYFIAGWGTTENGTSSRILLKAVVNHRNRSVCQNIFKKVSISSNHVCAEGDQGVDTCKGDSGGPLFFLGPFNITQRYVQYGIVSFGGIKCGARQTLPGIYADVVHFMPWITKNLDD